MDIQKFIPTRSKKDYPEVIIRDGKFYYNSSLKETAKLKDFPFVQYYFDHSTKEIGFKFLKTKEGDECFKITLQGGRSYTSRAVALIQKFEWIKAVQDLKQNHLKKFRAEKKSGLWIIRLMPSFERKINREKIGMLPNDSIGIYRYIRNDEIVYIGKGNIKERANDLMRRNWVFDIIEYSIVDKDSQDEFEAYWIEQFAHQNGQKPLYNLQLGNKSKATKKR